jgi:NADH:ubiquinone oxidoreductase subunit E
MKRLQMLETISPKQAQLRHTILHEAECGNDLHTAKHLATAGMLRAGGRLIPSDRYETIEILLKLRRTAVMTVTKQDCMFRTVRQGSPKFVVCLL